MYISVAKNGNGLDLGALLKYIQNFLAFSCNLGPWSLLGISPDSLETDCDSYLIRIQIDKLKIMNKVSTESMTNF